MVHLGTAIAGIGLVVLLHAGFSAAHYQQFLDIPGLTPQRESALSNLPADVLLEVLIGFVLATLGMMLSAGTLEPIRGAPGSGKVADVHESTPEFNIFQHRGKTLRMRLQALGVEQ